MLKFFGILASVMMVVWGALALATWVIPLFQAMLAGLAF